MANINLQPNVIAQAILKYVGGKDNISSIAYCMTRLRLTIVDEDKIERQALKKVEGVLGLTEQLGQLQIILGPGRVTKVGNELGKITGIQVGEIDEAKLRKAEINAKNSTPFKNLLKKISNIFIPLIPAFIACGLVMGISNIIIKFNPGFATSTVGGILSYPLL